MKLDSVVSKTLDETDAVNGDNEGLLGWGAFSLRSHQIEKGN